MPGQNLIEKIVQKYAVGLDSGQFVFSGDYISIKPAHVMTHDNTGAVIPKFRGIGAEKIFNSHQPVFALDHDIQNRDEANLKKYAKIEAFAEEHGIDFYPAGRGIGHQIMCEEGYAWPGTMVVASDSHSNMYGGLACLGTPVVRTDAAAIWATGRIWWQVPPVAKVEFYGKLKSGVTGKDVIIALCGFFNNDEVLNHAVEFTGDGVGTLAIDQRLTIANMTTEWGALAGLFRIDRFVIKWLKKRAEYIARRGPAGVPSDKDGDGFHPRLNKRRIGELESSIPRADPGCFYAKELSIDLGSIQPHVSGPDHVKVMTPVSEIRKKKVAINKAYLVSCVNSRVDDLKEAAEVVRGKKVAEGVEFYIAAASSEVQSESEAKGDWRALIDAGAIPLPPGCGPCIGLGIGLLQDGEVGISATNRNFKGRMGSKNAQAYLASPPMVVASAISGYIDAPGEYEPGDIIGDIMVNKKDIVFEKENKIIGGFPETITGELIFCHQDNLNTDGIYPGKYTYKDDFTPEQKAAVVMENYDPEFGEIVEKGDILVGGYNFGTGSSREQAATALKYKGIQLVITGSVSETYKRNAFNNGLLVIEAPELVDDLKNRFGKNMLTVKTELKAVVDFKYSTIDLKGKAYNFGSIGEAAQELIVAGGLENWIKENLR
jgi:homoaconitate hydratase